jgi:hypothetical protein
MRNAVSIFAFYQQIGITVGGRIAGEKDDYILGSPVEDLVEYYFDDYNNTPVEIDITKTHTIDIKKETRIIPARQREWAFQNEGDLRYEYEFVNVRIPILPHRKLDTIMSFQPSRIESGFFGEGINWTADAIVFDVVMKGYGVNKQEDGIKSEVEQSIQWVLNKLHYIAEDLQTANGQLKDHIRQNINNRKRKLEDDQARYSSLFKKINIPLHKKEDESVKHIRLDPKPLINRVRPNPQQPEEYELDEGKVLDIISVMDNQGRQFEKTPNTYLKLGEEDLRDILLNNLNALFEGKATGETFCVNGKTDIYLNIDKGNILSFECKFWAGQKVYQNTITQLLSYLTWRMNYGVLIFFSRQKNFSNVLTEGKHAIQEHNSYRGSLAEVSQSHFRSYHAIPADENKHVQLHHLFYTLGK